MMKIMKIVLLCVFVSAFVSASVYWLVTKQQNKIAVIDVLRLTNEYGMKNDLEKMASVKLKYESRQLDSLDTELQKAKALRKSQEEIETLSRICNYMKEKFEDEYAKSNQDINTQVWKRLNPLLDEFGKKEGFHLIIGANGMGSVLFVDGYHDITNEAIQYINKKYAEGN